MTAGATSPELRKFRRDLRALSVETAVEVKALDKEAATKAAGYARDNARSGSRLEAANAGAIKPYVSAAGASVGIATNGARFPAAGPAFWGTLRPLGWFARARYGDYTPGRQMPAWVGNDWEVAVHGQGPYAINDALADHGEEIAATYAAGLEELAHRTAFTD